MYFCQIWDCLCTLISDTDCSENGNTSKQRGIDLLQRSYKFLSAEPPAVLLCCLSVTRARCHWNSTDAEPTQRVAAGTSPPHAPQSELQHKMLSKQSLTLLAPPHFSFLPCTSQDTPFCLFPFPYPEVLLGKHGLVVAEGCSGSICTAMSEA